ncbi:MAG: hypothetical protein HMLKMBBP_00363 [Planctomycetes bacterium]|nr:hypothetical protein [Planctomycetota bacterium]
MPTKPGARRKRESVLLGVGLDGDDGHKRVTKARDAVVVGGSRETHELMQEHVVKFNEELDRRGKRLADVTHPEELREIAARAGMIRG